MATNSKIEWTDHTRRYRDWWWEVTKDRASDVAA